MNKLCENFTTQINTLYVWQKLSYFKSKNFWINMLHCVKLSDELFKRHTFSFVEDDFVLQKFEQSSSIQGLIVLVLKTWKTDMESR